MDESSNDEEREVLNRRRQKTTRQLQALTARDSSLDDATFELRRESLLKQIGEIERHLAEIDLDEQNLRRMEGGE